MTTEITKIEQITQDVSNLTKFEITVEKLKEEVKKTKHIKATDLEDKNQLAMVKRARIDLRQIEIDIEKTGKGYRDIFNKLNKGIIEKEKELLAITNPELERLKAIEKEAEDIATHKERIKILPYRKEQIKDFENIISDDELLQMDDNQFDKYLIDKTSEKAEQIRQAKEKADQEEKQRLAVLKAKEDAEAKAEEDARLAKIKADKEKDEAVAKAKADAEAEKQKLIDEQKAKEAKAKADAEAEKQKRAQLEAQKKYQKFLSDNGYSEKTKDEFYISNDGKKVILYRKIGEYIN